jgi:hypothetical protein
MCLLVCLCVRVCTTVQAYFSEEVCASDELICAYTRNCVCACVSLRMRDCVCPSVRPPEVLFPSHSAHLLTTPDGGKTEGGEGLMPECRRDATGKLLGHLGQKAPCLLSSRPSTDSGGYEARGRGMDGRIAAPSGTANPRTSRGMGIWVVRGKVKVVRAVKTYVEALKECGQTM